MAGVDFRIPRSWLDLELLTGPLSPTAIVKSSLRRNDMTTDTEAEDPKASHRGWGTGCRL